MDMSDLPIFPKGFRWGTAISAHQVEGGQDNDWTAWEPGHIADGTVSGVACDLWHRYDEDFALAASLGTNAFRLSFEWSRIEPQPGQWNEAALQHYRTIVDSLRRHGLEPWITLHHFTNPRWFAERGGWARSDAPTLFATYCRKVVERFPDVRHWITFNEPEVLTELGYLAGYWPPQKKSLFEALRVRQHVASAHRLAYQTIHRLQPNAHIGLANNLVAFEPADPWNPLDRIGSWISDRWHNRWFLDHVRGMIDFVGINYYTRTRISFRPWAPHDMFPGKIPPGAPISDMGWEIFSEGLGRVIDFASRFRKPIYILENGIADANDSRRSRFIHDHLAVLHRKIQEGHDVRGYFHWSLLDNFEWREGFAKRFGLYAVDFKTQKRTLRASGQYYASCGAENVLQPLRSTK